MRETCVTHRARQPIAIVREDYYLLTNKDCVAAAILNIFEYWANTAIAQNPEVVDPWLGEKTVKEIESLLLGMATDKSIRNRLHKLQDMGFIQTRVPCSYRKTLEYRFMITVVQGEIDKLLQAEKANGKITADSEESQRLNYRCTIYKKDHDQEEIRENIPPTPQGEKGEETIPHVKVEIVSEEIKSIPSPSPKVEDEPASSQQGLSVEASIPARENENDFRPLTGKNPKTGKEYLPWQGVITEKGKTRTSNDPAFVGYMAKHISSYSRYENRTLSELRIEANKYIVGIHKPGRIEELEDCWRDFCEGSDLPDISAKDIKRMSAGNKLMEMLKNRVKEEQ